MIKRGQSRRSLIKRRIRSRIRGTLDCPRLSVFRSNEHIYAQIVDDGEGKTLCSAYDGELSVKKGATKSEVASLVGELVANKLLALGKKRVVFDRNGYSYHGRVRALAEGSRKVGVVF